MEKEQYEYYRNYQLDDFVLDESFQRWVQGEKSRFWSCFPEYFPEKEDVIREAGMIINALSNTEKKLSKHDKEKQLLQIYDKVKQRNTSKIVKSTFFAGKWKYAAAISALIMLSGLAYYFFFSLPFQNYQTNYQQNKTFRLEDGTEVTLNANSTLRVQRDLQHKSIREVWLDGEAYFTVNKLRLEGSASTFVVHTDHLDVQVLGTHFNVKSRQGNTRVLLQEGSVKVANKSANEDILMEPGEAVEIDIAEGRLKKERVKERKELAWQENNFVFENETLTQVAEEIYQYYGLRVNFEDKELGKQIFTAEVSRDNLPLLQTLIEEAFALHITKENDQLIFRRKH